MGHRLTLTMDWTALKLLLEGIEPGKWRKRYRLRLEKKNDTNSRSPVSCWDVEHDKNRGAE
jgi:hypothetical protein